MFARVQGDKVVKYPYTETDLRTDNPTTSFPPKITETHMRAFGAVPVDYGPVVPRDRRTHRSAYSDTPELRDGRWILPMVVLEKTQAQIDDERERSRSAIRTRRAKAYQTEADFIFFKWQRGSATKEEWLAAVEAVKARYPYEE